MTHSNVRLTLLSLSTFNTEPAHLSSQYTDTTLSAGLSYDCPYILYKRDCYYTYCIGPIYTISLITNIIAIGLLGYLQSRQDVNIYKLTPVSKSRKFHAELFIINNAYIITCTL